MYILSVVLLPFIAAINIATAERVAAVVLLTAAFAKSPKKMIILSVPWLLSVKMAIACTISVVLPLFTAATLTATQARVVQVAQLTAGSVKFPKKNQNPNLSPSPNPSPLLLNQKFPSQNRKTFLMVPDAMQPLNAKEDSV